jgi:two-component system cell cycle response regulator
VEPETVEVDEDPAITLLVVERERSVRRALVDRLEGRGYTVRATLTCAEAAALLAEQEYDVLVIGWMLSDGEGLDLLQHVRARHAAADLPVIMVSASEEAADVVRAFDRGANDFISTPINPAIALARIHSHVSLRRARMALRRQALVDELTQLYNRRYIMSQLGALVAASRRYGHALSVCIADIDHFKAVNDTHGHQAGDAALRQLARLIRQRVRGSDVPGRFGGDELCVVFPHTTAREAVVPIEAIARSFADDPLVHHGRALDRLTASFGIAEVGPHANSVEALVAAADAALYRAKALGRDRICWDQRGAELEHVSDLVRRRFP